MGLLLQPSNECHGSVGLNTPVEVGTRSRVVGILHWMDRYGKCRKTNYSYSSHGYSILCTL